MTKLIKCLFWVLIVCTITPVAVGAREIIMTPMATPFIGMDFEYSIIKPNNDWRNVLSTVYPGGNAFVGIRFMEYIGFELGYSFTGKKEKTRIFNGQQSFFGVPAPFLVNAGVRTQMSLNGWHVDLLAFIPLDHCIDLFIAPGVGTAKAKINVDVVTTAPLTISPFAVAPIVPIVTPFNVALSSVSTQGKTILRLGLGIQWMLTDITGVRAIIRWRNTSRVSIRNNAVVNAFFAANNISRQIYKDAVTASAGIFFRFY